MRELIFVDTETTGLNSETDQLVELSYARREGPIKTLYFGVEEVPDFIDGFIKFTERGIAGRKSSADEIMEFLSLSEDQTMVAANPHFDRTFMTKVDLYKFHYRTLDVETYAMSVLRLDEMPSMRDVFEILKEEGFTLPEPDHTSAGDVAALREAYNILHRLNEWDAGL